MAIQIILLCLLYPEVHSCKPCTDVSICSQRIYQPLFNKTLTITIGLLVAFGLGFPLANFALVAASLLLITRRLKPQRIFRKIDWNLLVIFSRLFILTKVIQKLNILHFYYWGNKYI